MHRSGKRRTRSEEKESPGKRDIKRVRTLSSASLATTPKTLQDKIQCSLCQDVLTIPHRLCSNGHYVCTTELIDLFSHNRTTACFDRRTFMPIVVVTEASAVSVKCPTCREDVSWQDIIRRTPDPMIHYLLGFDDQQPCRFSGCMFRGHSQALAKHLLQCEHSTVPCPYCYDPVVPAHMADHLRSVCNQLRCRFCEDSPKCWTAASLRVHMKTIHAQQTVLYHNVCRKLNLVLDQVTNTVIYQEIDQDNVPVNADAIQELLRLNTALQLFLTHHENTSLQGLQNVITLPESELVKDILPLV